jgi:hypothetical protein
VQSPACAVVLTMSDRPIRHYAMREGRRVLHARQGAPDSLSAPTLRVDQLLDELMRTGATIETSIELVYVDHIRDEHHANSETSEQFRNFHS